MIHVNDSTAYTICDTCSVTGPPYYGDDPCWQNGIAETRAFEAGWAYQMVDGVRTHVCPACLTLDADKIQSSLINDAKTFVRDTESELDKDLSSFELNRLHVQAQLMIISLLTHQIEQS